ncbi:MAG: MazG-like family protein [Oscillospiraceae bacterium]|nr:MazG-like family protein [Oscillospiraceae bacterium]
MMTKDNNIDEWVNYINQIYEQSNSERSFKDIIVLFYEDIGKCFQLINRKREKDIENLLPSMFKWFCALYAKNENKVHSVSDLLWNKFPGICPYCLKTTCRCHIRKGNLNIVEIADKAKNGKETKPKTINEWQTHFQQIYPRNPDATFITNVSHLAEELAELSEAHRKRHIKKDVLCVEMELADVFTWIIGLANLIHQLKETDVSKNYFFGDVISAKFKNGCPNCHKFRKEYKLKTSCGCLIKEQSFELIADYKYEEEVLVIDQNTDEKPKC